MIYKLRIKTANALLLAGNTTLDFFVMIADMIRGESITEQYPDSYWRLKGAAMSSKLHYIQNHPCQKCHGVGGVEIGDGDAVACPVCKGFGIDPIEILRQVTL